LNKEFELFASFLLKWNKTHNLTGSKDIKEVFLQIQDSIKPLEFLPKGFKTVLDIGSGAGFPAIPMAIIKKDVGFTLCEPIKKRVAFLNYIKIKLNLKNITIINTRVQELPKKTYDIITSKAVANAKTIFELAKDFMDKDSRLLLYKSKKEKVELKADVFESQNSRYFVIQK